MLNIVHIAAQFRTPMIMFIGTKSRHPIPPSVLCAVGVARRLG